jgi:cytochrome d ubiquinol oxidase subunit I
MSLVSKEVGIKTIRPDLRPPMLIPFFAFRVMVGCGLLMLAIAWLGSLLSLGERMADFRLFLWATFLSFPLGFIATLTGWFTAEVGRQPWAIYGVLRTAEAMTPVLTTGQVGGSLAVFLVIYAFIFGFGVHYIYRLLRAGPAVVAADPAVHGNQARLLSMPRSDLKPYLVEAGE